MAIKRIYADRAPYMIEAVRKRRIKLREMAREYKGGKCEICEIHEGITQLPARKSGSK